MRWLRYQADDRDAYGIIEGDEVVEVAGDPFAGYSMTRTRRKLRDVKFLVPVIPKDAGELVQYEAELVAVIGTQAKHLSERDAFSCILGWTIGNDMSERTWQRNDRTLWRAKNTDTFKPMGPWIETDFDLDKAETIVRVNDEVTDKFRTNNMIHGVAKFISRMSQYLTLYPGDVVWMGTEGAPRNLKHGDVCEIEITGIGILRNPLVRAAA